MGGIGRLVSPPRELGDASTEHRRTSAVGTPAEKEGTCSCHPAPLALVPLGRCLPHQTLGTLAPGVHLIVVDAGREGRALVDEAIHPWRKLRVGQIPVATRPAPG